MIPHLTTTHHPRPTLRSSRLWGSQGGDGGPFAQRPALNTDTRALQPRRGAGWLPRVSESPKVTSATRGKRSGLLAFGGRKGAKPLCTETLFDHPPRTAHNLPSSAPSFLFYDHPRTRKPLPITASIQTPIARAAPIPVCLQPKQTPCKYPILRVHCPHSASTPAPPPSPPENRHGPGTHTRTHSHKGGLRHAHRLTRLHPRDRIRTP